MAAPDPTPAEPTRDDLIQEAFRYGAICAARIVKALDHEQHSQFRQRVVAIAEGFWAFVADHKIAFPEDTEAAKADVELMLAVADGFEYQYAVAHGQKPQPEAVGQPPVVPAPTAPK